ncbi:MAG TPA: substrate-binding domain-containing protein [Anaerolineaceae bacterium]
MTSKVSRRNFLKTSMVFVGGAALSACQPTATAAPSAAPKPGATTAPAATTVPVGPAPKVTIWFPAAPCGDGSNAERLAAVKKVIQDAINVDVNGVIAPPGTAGTEKLNLMITSKTEDLDVFEGDWSQYKDLIIPLNDLLDKYGQNVLKAFPKDLWGTMKDSTGKIYGWPRGFTYNHTNKIWFRTDWLNELKLKMPETIDETEKVIAEFKKAKPDSVVLTSNHTDLMRCTLGGFTEFGYSSWVDPKDKMLKPYFLQPGYEDWLAKMVDWWNKGWFQKETFANVDIRAQLKTLNVGVYPGWYSRITLWWEQIRADGNLTKEDYGFFNGVKGPKGFAQSVIPSGNSAYMITRKCKNPEAVIKYLDWVLTGVPKDNTNSIVSAYGVENTDWKWIDKSKGVFQHLISECGKRYDGQLLLHKGYPEVYWLAADASGKINRHQEHIYKYSLDFSTGKMPVDFDVPYDVAAIRKQFPGLNDFNTLIDQELVKFLTGQRPLTQWADFIKQVQGAGLDQWSQLYTEQFRKYHPA